MVFYFLNKSRDPHTEKAYLPFFHFGYARLFSSHPLVSREARIFP